MRNRLGSATAIGLLCAMVTTSLAAQDNAGFEDGVQNGEPLGWQVVTTDAVTVVDTETPQEHPVLGDFGNVTVAPERGDLMVRLGTPKDGSNSKPKGKNAVLQPFVLDRNEIELDLKYGPALELYGVKRTKPVLGNP